MYKACHGEIGAKSSPTETSENRPQSVLTFEQRLTVPKTRFVLSEPTVSWIVVVYEGCAH